MQILSGFIATNLEKEIKNIEKLIRDLSKLKTFHSSDYEKKIFPKEDTDKINSMVLEHGFKLNLFDITKNESDDISENWDNVSAHSNHSEKSHYSIISNQELEKIKNKQSNEKRQTEQFDKTHKNLTPKIRYDTQNQDETFGMELSTLK